MEKFLAYRNEIKSIIHRYRVTFGFHFLFQNRFGRRLIFFLWERKIERVKSSSKTMNQKKNNVLRNTNIILLMPRFNSSIQGGRVNHLVEVFMNSARALGAGVSHIAIDEFTYGNRRAGKDFLNKTQLAFDSNLQNILVFDANHIPEDEAGEFSRNDLIQFSESAQIVGCIFDYYLGQPERIGYWIEKCDVITVFTPCLGPRLYRWADHAKVVVFPFTPTEYFRNLFSTSEKTRLFFYDGSKARHRDLFLSLLPVNREDIKISFHSNSDKTAISHDEYLNEMAKSLLTFTNGFTVSGEHILTDRVRESLLAGCLPLCEYSRSIRYFLREYEHYFPVKNRYEVKLALEFFQRNPMLARRLASQGREFVSKNYSPEKYWSAVQARLRGA